MCKIFVLTNMSKIKNLSKTVDIIAENLSHYEKDGFGYSIQSETGLFGERTTSKSFVSSWDKEILDLPFLNPNYNRFGTVGKNLKAGIFHGRTSTNKKNIVNTHPINKNGWSLIHNGVVSHHGPDYSMQSTNDTEHLVHCLSTRGIAEIEKNITGYYAVAAFSPDQKLHVIKDDIASLYFCHVKSLDSYIFGTSEALIESICNDLKLKTSKITPLSDNVHLVIKNNVVESHKSIKPRGRTAYESKYSELSLGRKLTEVKSEVKAETSWYDNTETESQSLFLAEVEGYADSSYTFLDYRNNTITLSEFNKLDDDNKMYCTVIRSDGTVCSATDYHTEKLYTG